MKGLEISSGVNAITGGDINIILVESSREGSKVDF